MAAVLGLTAPGLRLSYRSLGLSALSFGLPTPADGRVDLSILGKRLRPDGSRLLLSIF